jgi:hypothetical protein
VKPDVTPRVFWVAAALVLTAMFGAKAVFFGGF